MPVNTTVYTNCQPNADKPSAPNTYLLLVEFSVRTVNYGPSFFPSIYARAGHKSMEKKTRIGNLQYGPKKRG